MEDDGSVVALGKLFAVFIIGFVEPAVEVVGWLDGIISGDISCKDVVGVIPRIDVVSIGRDGKTVGAELGLDDAGDNALCVESTTRPFKLAVRVGTIVLTLVPEGDWDFDSLWVAE